MSLLQVPELFNLSERRPLGSRSDINNNNAEDMAELRQQAVSPTNNISKYSMYTSSLVIDLQQCSSPSLRPERTEPKEDYMIGAGLIRNYANSDQIPRTERESPTEFKINASGHHRARGYRSMHDRLFNFRYWSFCFKTSVFNSQHCWSLCYNLLQGFLLSVCVNNAS